MLVFSGDINPSVFPGCVYFCTNQTPLAIEKALEFKCEKKAGTLLRWVLAVQRDMKMFTVQSSGCNQSRAKEMWHKHQKCLLQHDFSMRSAYSTPQYYIMKESLTRLQQRLGLNVVSC